MEGKWRIYFTLSIDKDLLVEETQYFPSRLFAPGLFVRQNTVGRGQDQVSELTTGQQVDDPLLNLTVFNIETRTNYPAFIETTRQLDHNFTGSVIVYNFKLANISCDFYDSMVRQIYDIGEEALLVSVMTMCLNESIFFGKC